MVKRKNGGNGRRKQVRTVDGKGRGERVARITPDTPYGECSERLTAFGGLLTLVKFLNLIGFEKAFGEH